MNSVNSGFSLIYWFLFTSFSQESSIIFTWFNKLTGTHGPLYMERELLLVVSWCKLFIYLHPPPYKYVSHTTFAITKPHVKYQTGIFYPRCYSFFSYAQLFPFWGLFLPINSWHGNGGQFCALMITQSLCTSFSLLWHIYWWHCYHLGWFSLPDRWLCRTL